VPVAGAEQELGQSRTLPRWPQARAPQKLRNVNPDPGVGSRIAHRLRWNLSHIKQFEHQARIANRCPAIMQTSYISICCSGPGRNGDAAPRLIG
jgi:hypothetical protein